MLDWLASRFNDIIDFFWRLVLSIFDMLKDLFYFIIESLLSVGVVMLDGIGLLMNGLDIAQYMTMLPPETTNMLSQVGLGQAMGMIVTCLTVRFVLQTIPFVRWGS
ncbi:MAG: DUF2523 family protein [Colwellia sp.]|nr:DUF2523 family protein [Colwellia sp.]